MKTKTIYYGIFDPKNKKWYNHRNILPLLPKKGNGDFIYNIIFTTFGNGNAYLDHNKKYLLSEMRRFSPQDTITSGKIKISIADLVIKKIEHHSEYKIVQ